jgi:uncharacterized membrane protein
LIHPIIVILPVAVLAVLVLDTVGSLASRRYGFRYGSLTLISWALRIATGFFAARYGTIKISFFAGGAVALIDATLGWYISWKIGPGRPQGEITSDLLVNTVLVVTLTGAALGFIGGLLA